MAAAQQHPHPGTNQRYGWLRRKWYALVGVPDEARSALEEVAGHGAMLMRLARGMSFLTMIGFSFGALYTLGYDGLQQIISEWRAGGFAAINPSTAIGLVIVGLFVFAMDFAMMLASMKVRDEIRRGVQATSLWPYFVLIGFIAALEAGTYMIMVARIEQPVGAIAWGFLTARAIAVPTVAIFLALLGPRPIGRQDIQSLIQLRSGAGLIEYVNAAIQLDKANPAQLWKLFALVNGAQRNLSDEQWDRQIMDALSSLTTDSQQVQHDTQLAQLRAQIEQQQALLSAFESGVPMQREALRGQLQAALAHLAATGQIPEDLGLEEDEIAALRDLLAPAARGRQRAAKATPTTKRGRIIAFLESVGIAPATTPARKKGVWISSSDVASLISRPIAADTIRDLVKRLGDEQKVGTAYVAPFERIMSELAERHLLSEVAAEWWAEFAASGDENEGDSTSLRTERYA